MPTNHIQFQPGLSWARFFEHFGCPEQCRQALMLARMVLPGSSEAGTGGCLAQQVSGVAEVCLQISAGRRGARAEPGLRPLRLTSTGALGLNLLGIQEALHAERTSEHTKHASNDRAHCCECAAQHAPCSALVGVLTNAQLALG